MSKLIGVIGIKRSGKDTTADELCNNYNYVKYSLAEPLKRGCMDMFGFTEDQVFNDAKDDIDPNWGCTPRDVLKIMGTEICQYNLQEYLPAFEKIGRLIWVKRFEQWYKNNLDKNIVVADVRFKHEADYITSLGGEIWRVDRPGTDTTDLHASEREIFEIPYKHLLVNDSTLEHLYNLIYECIKIKKGE